MAHSQHTSHPLAHAQAQAWMNGRLRNGAARPRRALALCALLALVAVAPDLVTAMVSACRRRAHTAHRRRTAGWPAPAGPARADPRQCMAPTWRCIHAPDTAIMMIDQLFSAAQQPPQSTPTHTHITPTGKGGACACHLECAAHWWRAHSAGQPQPGSRSGWH